MTGFCGKYLLRYRAAVPSERKFSKRDSNIHQGCIPVRREAGRTPPSSPCSSPPRPQQASRDAPSDYYFRTERPEVICAMFCGCRCLQRRAKRLESNLLFPSFTLGNNIQNQEHVLLRCAHQPLHETDQPLLVHGVLINHEPDAALAADGRDHIDPLPVRLHWQHGRTTLRGEAAFYYVAVAYPSLICPIDDGVFRFRTLQNSGIFLVFPPLDARRLLSPRTLHRALAAHAPALHVIRQRPLVNRFVEFLLDIFPRPSQCPQPAGDSEFFRHSLHNCLPDILLLFRG